MERLRAIVTRVKTETPSIKTVYFLLADGSRLAYTAGQYITVFINGSPVPQGKAYSLSSAPHEPHMSITVKDVGGEYSTYLCGLKKGGTFMISRAYGFFNPKTDRPLVALAAGVGISPIVSVLKDEAVKNKCTTHHLFYSNKSHQHIPHGGSLHATKAAIHHHITGESDVPAGMAKGRIVLDECVNAAEDAFYLVCGSVAFAKDMWRGLTERGVMPDSISTETFFES